jgi:hypothetical protein
MTDCFITLLPFAGLEVQAKGNMILDVSTVKNILEVCTPPIAIEYTQYSINDPFAFAYDSDGLGLSFGELGHG